MQKLAGWIFIILAMAILIGSAIFVFDFIFKKIPPQFLSNKIPLEANVASISFGNESRENAAIKQLVYVIEKSLAETETKDQILANKLLRIKAFRCLLSIYPSKKAREVLDKTIYKMLDTPERQAIFKKLSSYIGPKALITDIEAGSTPIAERKFSCEF